jgi:uncharacterized membrane protein
LIYRNHHIKGVIMKRIRRLVSTLVTLAAGLLALGSAPAWAERVPPGGINDTSFLAPLPRQVHVAASGGMPGWEITLIAVGAALVAAVLAVLLDRARGARRLATVPAA